MYSKLDKLFLRELGIEIPTEKQLDLVSMLSENEKSIPIILSALENKKSYAQIAQQLSTSKSVIVMRICRVKKKRSQKVNDKK